MNNKTQPTPEQLTKWREEAARAYMDDDSVNDHVHAILAYEFGYLRAKQEVDQHIKHLQDILEVVETRFELTPTDRAFLKSFWLRKELLK